jgi:acetylornithine/succinyldiaminopimelate/putrescine aminotransferase
MVYGEHIQTPQICLATALIDRTPESMDQVYFLSSGSEAIEAALKIAKLHTRRTGVRAAARAYHGSTIGAESLRSDIDFIQDVAPLVPGVKHFRFNHIEDLDTITSEVGCVIMEPVQAEAGIVVPTKDFMKAVRTKCDEVGALLIFDEIQVGLGRTGSLFAFQQFDVEPDILVLGKAIGGGLPLSAVIAPKDIMESISRKVPLAHLTTFGGHPLCCATGSAVFNYICENEMWVRAEEIGQRFEQGLKDGPWEFKRHGAMFGLRWQSEDDTVKFQNALHETGVLCDLLLFDLGMVRFAPPLIISDEEIEKGIEMIRVATVPS